MIESPISDEPMIFSVQHCRTTGHGLGFADKSCPGHQEQKDEGEEVRREEEEERRGGEEEEERREKRRRKGK